MMLNEVVDAIKREASADCAPSAGWASLVEAVKAWRKAEKRHALMVLGELGGDADEAKDIADRKLHAVRIEAEKIEARPNNAICKSHEIKSS